MSHHKNDASLLRSENEPSHGGGPGRYPCPSPTVPLRSPPPQVQPPPTFLASNAPTLLHPATLHMETEQAMPTSGHLHASTPPLISSAETLTQATDLLQLPESSLGPLPPGEPPTDPAKPQPERKRLRRSAKNVQQGQHDAIRKRQNVESSVRSRLRKQAETRDMEEAIGKNDAIIKSLNTRLARMEDGIAEAFPGVSFPHSSARESAARLNSVSAPSPMHSPFQVELSNDSPASNQPSDLPPQQRSPTRTTGLEPNGICNPQPTLQNMTLGDVRQGVASSFQNSCNYDPVDDIYFQSE